MAPSRGKSKKQEVDSSAVELKSEVPAEVAASPLYGVAMLKIAMELKKADSRPLEELVRSVLQRMQLPEEDFHQFLVSNGGLLRAIALKRKY